MAFFPSTPPDITESIPSVISARLAAATYAPSTNAYDIAIADLPFMLQPDSQAPYTRETADYRKDQFDSSKEAGEHSLSGALWTRSQASWHHGAGIKYYEPGSDDGTDFRFDASVGVDVWTEGEVTLLHSMDQQFTSGSFGAGPEFAVCSAVIGGQDAYFANTGGALSRSFGAGSISYDTLTTGVGAPVVAGGTVLMGATDGLYSGDASGTSMAAMFAITGDPIYPHWVKSRIIAVKGPNLYECTLADTSLPATPLYTHPDDNWVWTGVTETTDAILASGYSNGVSAIYRFTLEDAASGQIPILGQAYQITEMPPGEEIYCIKAYLGTYLGIGTSLGLRVGILGASTTTGLTTVQYGPLLFESAHPVTSLAARDSFIYAGVEAEIDGSSGVVRVSLEEEVVQGSLRFPYATDAQTHGIGTVASLCFLGTSDRVAVGVYGQGIWLQSNNLYELNGYLRTGRVRYDTSENKIFRTLAMRAVYPDTNVGVSVTTIAPGGSSSFILRQTSDSAVSDDLTITRPQGLWEYLGFQIGLDGVGSDTPTLNSYLVKALPAPKRERLISFPLACYDHERDSRNTAFGTDRFAYLRLAALEALESVGVVAKFQDYRTGESFEGLIEKVQFINPTPSGKSNPSFGGRLLVTARRFA